MDHQHDFMAGDTGYYCLICGETLRYGQEPEGERERIATAPLLDYELEDPHLTIPYGKVDYEQFLQSKLLTAKEGGFEVSLANLHPMLFDWQKLIVQWALRLGRAALFEDTGLGKTIQQVEWARQVVRHTGGRVLIVCPLAVALQTIREAKKIDVEVHYRRGQEELSGDEDIVIVNYDMLKHFRADYFTGIVLDESSILKSYAGKVKNFILKFVESIPYRLFCTATPAPNDHLELGNHAQGLGVMPSNEMIARWFSNTSGDGDDMMIAGKYRLKSHGARDFWRWVTSWAVCISKPSDLGPEFSDEGYIRPPLDIRHHQIEVDHQRAWGTMDSKGQYNLFLASSLSATEMWQEKKITYQDRCQKALAEIAKEPDEYHIVWCDTNDESGYMYRGLCALFGADQVVEVKGSDSIAKKERDLEAFSTGRARAIVTKSEIAGLGLNWQHCARHHFVSVNYSWEKWYQSTKRTDRYGNPRQTIVNMYATETEQNIISTLRRKGQAHLEMQQEVNAAIKQYGLSIQERRLLHLGGVQDVARGEDWTYYLGDCVLTLQNIRRNQPDFEAKMFLYSPPFALLYIYSDRVEDMGNCANEAEFMEGYSYLLREAYRATTPGGWHYIHCKDLMRYMSSHTYAGLYDFPGDIIQAAQSAGFVFQKWVTVWKDPVVEMQRTKTYGLLHKSFAQRAEVCRQGCADYVLVFRKPLVEGQDLTPDSSELMSEIQPDVIRRCVHLWTNPGERVAIGQADIYADSDELIKLAILNESLDTYTGEFIQELSERVQPGRLCLVRCKLLDLPGGKYDMMGNVIEQFEAQGAWKFHSRVALTDGYWLIAFRNWRGEFENNIVKHGLKAPKEAPSKVEYGYLGLGLTDTDTPHLAFYDKGGVIHPDYVGTKPPTLWHDDGYYSVLVWQRYASPVWFDLHGLPLTHPDCWMDIDQTNVLNYRVAKDEEDERHICPLQLDLIERCILEATESGDIVYSPYGGIASESVTAIKLGRKAVSSELKDSYWHTGVKYLREVEIAKRQVTLFDLAGVEI